jgi:hypothetical protein
LMVNRIPPLLMHGTLQRSIHVQRSSNLCTTIVYQLPQNSWMFVRLKGSLFIRLLWSQVHTNHVRLSQQATQWKATDIGVCLHTVRFDHSSLMESHWQRALFLARWTEVLSIWELHMC